jgi:hypothetical protein
MKDILEKVKVKIDNMLSEKTLSLGWNQDIFDYNDIEIIEIKNNKVISRIKYIDGNYHLTKNVEINLIDI